MIFISLGHFYALECSRQITFFVVANMNVNPNFPDSTFLDQDRDLWERLKNGDYEAFTEIYNRYQASLTRRLLQLLKSTELVEEILQEIFMRLWSSRENLDTQKSANAYLFKIAENLVVDVYRKASRDQKLKEELIRAAHSYSQQIENGYIEAQDILLIEHAIQQMPPRQREIYKLCKIDGMKYSEVAQHLGTSEAAVNKHITAGNKFLRKFLTSERGGSLSLLLAVSYILTHLNFSERKVY